MSTTPLRVLILEDQPADGKRMIDELEQFGFNPLWQRIDTEEAFADALDTQLDLILADYDLARFDALRALAHLQRTGLDIPFIIIAGNRDEDLAMAAVKQGAANYLFKDRLARLGPAAAHALEQRRLREEKRKSDQHLRASERCFRALIEHGSDGISMIDERGIRRYASPSVVGLLGYAPEELVGRSTFELTHPNDLAAVQAGWLRLLANPGSTLTMQLRFLHRDGSWRWIERVWTNLLAEPSAQAVIANYRDITERKQLEDQEHELRLAHRIQQGLLPTAPPDLPGFDIAGASYPATALAGDYYDFLPLGDDGLGIVIGDVCGHGIGSALLMARAQAYLRALGLTYQENGRRAADRIAPLVSSLNRLMTSDLSPDLFVTLFLGRLSLRTREFAFLGAGHPAALVLDRGGSVKATLKSEALPLGIRLDADFPPSATVPLAAGDLLVLLTDGIVEARAPDNTVFGTKRTLDIVRHYRDRPARQILDNLYHAVRAFSQYQPQRDDVTAVVVKVI
jgi:PAS domain S-box-containing protein